MNDCEETGIVGLEDLPEKEVYVNLKEDFHKGLEKKIRFYGISRLCKELDISKRIVCHWLSDNSLIRLDVLNKILRFFYYDLNNKIDFIRGKDGGCIYNPKLSFNFNNQEGVRIIAAILGDGGIPTMRNSPFYSNSNKFQIDGFLKDLNNVFGKVDYSINRIRKENTVVEVVSLFSLIQKVFLKIGLKKGKKVETNPGIPKFIFNLDENKIYGFLSQLFDDEGSLSINSRHLVIKLVVCSKFDKHNLIEGTKLLFNKLDFIVNVYKNKKDVKKDEWRIEIHRREQIEKLSNKLNLRNFKKTNKIKLLLDSYKQYHYPFVECENVYFSSMKKFEKDYGYFTTKMLASDLKRKVGHIRNMVSKYRKMNKIECIENYTSGAFHNFAKYKVII